MDVPMESELLLSLREQALTLLSLFHADLGLSHGSLEVEDKAVRLGVLAGAACRSEILG